MLSPERSDQALVCYLLESMRTRIFLGVSAQVGIQSGWKM